MIRRSLLTAVIVLAVGGTALASGYPPDPKGDDKNCTGECSTKGTDLKTIDLSLTKNRKTLEIEVTQYDAFKGTQPLYWPQVELYTTKRKSYKRPIAPWKNAQAADYSVFVDSKPGGYGMYLWTGSNKGPAVDYKITTPKSIVYKVPLSKLGDPAKVWARAWQSNSQAKARDVAPDQGVVSITVRKPIQNAEPGHYAWEQGIHTYDNAVFFEVQKSHGGKGRKIVGLQYRNNCLSNNDPNPPEIQVQADGSFSRKWTAQGTPDKVGISLSGKFYAEGKAKGTLGIDDGPAKCHTRAKFKVHTPPQCSDHKDNDGDGRIDRGNPPSTGDHGCTSAIYDDSESPDTF